MWFLSAKSPKNGKFQEIFFIAFFTFFASLRRIFLAKISLFAIQYKHKHFKFCTLLPAHNQSNHFVGSKLIVFLGQFLLEHPYPILGIVKIFQWCYSFSERTIMIFWMIFLGNIFSLMFQEKRRICGWDLNPETII